MKIILTIIILFTVSCFQTKKQLAIRQITSKEAQKQESLGCKEKYKSNLPTICFEMIEDIVSSAYDYAFLSLKQKEDAFVKELNFVFKDGFKKDISSLRRRPFLIFKPIRSERLTIVVTGEKEECNKELREMFGKDEEDINLSLTECRESLKHNKWLLDIDFKDFLYLELIFIIDHKEKGQKEVVEKFHLVR